VNGGIRAITAIDILKRLAGFSLSCTAGGMTADEQSIPDYH
jgi:hypothetical protein